MKSFKHSFFTIIIILIAFTSTAQESFTAKTKGTFFTNGSLLVNYTTHKVEDDKATTFSTNMTPKVGYFIIDNLTIGLELSILSSKEESKNEDFDVEVKSSGFAFKPFARYYLFNGIFGEAVVGYGFQKNSSNIFSEEYKSTTFGFRVGAGYSFFLGSHVAIEPTINYSWEDINPVQASSDYNESLSSIFLGIGISAYF